MFLDFIKDFFIKRKLKNRLSQFSSNFSVEKIKTIGIIVDESYFLDKHKLVQELLGFEIDVDDIQLMIYKDKIKKTEVIEVPFLSYKDLKWNGSIENQQVKKFISQNFDLLINYYDIEKAPLLLVSQQSKAKFKVGFATIDKRINHFMIDTAAENYIVFTNELFRYLKILNKI